VLLERVPVKLIRRAGPSGPAAMILDKGLKPLVNRRADLKVGPYLCGCFGC